MSTRLLLCAAAVAAVACPGPKPTPVAPGPRPAPVALVVPTTPAVDPYASLDLGFEDVQAGKARKWSVEKSDGYELVAVADDVHGGAHSFRIRATGGGPFGATTVSFDATPVRGKRVRLHGWIKTDGVGTGWAAVWLRVEGPTIAFDNMQGRGIVGSTPWAPVFAEVEVPADGQSVVVGTLLAGTGTAWFDDLRIEVGEIVPPQPIVVAGTVVDATGAPVAGAEVALLALNAVETHVTTGADGAFRFATVQGRWGLSAHHAPGVGAFIAMTRYDADTTALTLKLGASGGVTVRGRFIGGTFPAGTFATIFPVSENDADLFAVPVAADGAFSAVLPRGDEYRVEVMNNAVGAGNLAREGETARGDIAVAVLGPPPDEVVAWIDKNGAELTTAEAGNGFADMATFGKIVGKARVVALGEATHGTSEFFQLKHRVLEYLVSEQGFTVFAIEANQPECRTINAYVLRGEGDAKTALDGIYFWTWNTEEVLAMIEWMRAWNTDPKHDRKVQFLGFDMQTSSVSHARVASYIAEVGGDAALVEAVKVLGDDNAVQTISAYSSEQQAALAKGLAALAAAFDANAKAWRAKQTKDSYDDMRHDVTVMEQASRYFAGHPLQQFEIRDVSMADNVDWILAHQPKRTRIVLWAHNGHIANTLPTFTNMGSHLRKRYGKDYVNIGFLFGHGAFQAMDWSTRTRSVGPTEIRLGPAPESDLSAPFSRTGKAILALDLRRIPKKGTVHDWFAAPHPRRETGAVFTTEREMTTVDVFTTLFDAAIFVASTTRARPIARPAKRTGD